MNLNLGALLFFMGVVMFAGIIPASAQVSPYADTTAGTTTSAVTPAAPAKAATSRTQLRKRTPPKPDFEFHSLLYVSRSTSLIDFEDGTRQDSMDYLFKPSLKMPVGTVAATFAYTQDLRDKYSGTASDWSDIPVAFTFKPTTWKWNASQQAKVSYSLTAVMPLSKMSVKKDELQTSLGAGVSFSVAPVADGFNYGVSVTAARNLHAYEEDINGQVLNQYSSNQTLSAGYTYGDWSVSVDFVNRARWTYQGNTKNTFELTEELGYAVNDAVSLAVGHTNAGAGLKPNGTDSNIDLYDENDSIVYATLGLAY